MLTAIVKMVLKLVDIDLEVESGTVRLLIKIGETVVLDRKFMFYPSKSEKIRVSSKGEL